MKQDYPPSGVYKHYKGGFYEVIGIGKHSETHEVMVIYKDVHSEKKIWVRPMEMWFDEVLVGGVSVFRFVKISD